MEGNGKITVKVGENDVPGKLTARITAKPAAAAPAARHRRHARLCGPCGGGEAALEWTQAAPDAPLVMRGRLSSWARTETRQNFEARLTRSPAPWLARATRPAMCIRCAPLLPDLDRFGPRPKSITNTPSTNTVNWKRTIPKPPQRHPRLSSRHQKRAATEKPFLSSAKRSMRSSKRQRTIYMEILTTKRTAYALVTGACLSLSLLGLSAPARAQEATGPSAQSKEQDSQKDKQKQEAGKEQSSSSASDCRCFGLPGNTSIVPWTVCPCCSFSYSARRGRLPARTMPTRLCRLCCAPRCASRATIR